MLDNESSLANKNAPLPEQSKRAYKAIRVAFFLLAVGALVALVQNSVSRNSVGRNMALSAGTIGEDVVVPVVKEPFSTYANMKTFIQLNGCPNIGFQNPHWGAVGHSVTYDSMGCEVTPSTIKIRVKMGNGGHYFRTIAEYTMASSNSLSCKLYHQDKPSGVITFVQNGFPYYCEGNEHFLRLVAQGPAPMKVLPPNAASLSLLIQQNACPSQLILKSTSGSELALFESSETCYQDNHWDIQSFSQQLFNGNTVLLKYVVNSTPSVVDKLAAICVTVYSPTGNLVATYRCVHTGHGIDLAAVGIAPAPFTFVVNMHNIVMIY